MVKLCIKCRLREKRPHNSYCAECHNNYMKKWYKKRGYKNQVEDIAKKREYIKKKKDKECADCGIKYPWYVMDYDHLRGKSFNLSTAANKGYSIKRIQQEINKCDVVCANCHRERTFSRGSSPCS